jgi:hypothetical protein
VTANVPAFDIAPIVRVGQRQVSDALTRFGSERKQTLDYSCQDPNGHAPARNHAQILQLRVRIQGDDTNAPHGRAQVEGKSPELGKLTQNGPKDFFVEDTTRESRQGRHQETNVGLVFGPKSRQVRTGPMSRSNDGQGQACEGGSVERQRRRQRKPVNTLGQNQSAEPCHGGEYGKILGGKCEVFHERQQFGSRKVSVGRDHGDSNRCRVAARGVVPILACEPDGSAVVPSIEKP